MLYELAFIDVRRETLDGHVLVGIRVHQGEQRLQFFQGKAFAPESLTHERKVELVTATVAGVLAELGGGLEPLDDPTTAIVLDLRVTPRATEAVLQRVSDALLGVDLTQSFTTGHPLIVWTGRPAA